MSGVSGHARCAVLLLKRFNRLRCLLAQSDDFSKTLSIERLRVFPAVLGLVASFEAYRKEPKRLSTYYSIACPNTGRAVIDSERLDRLTLDSRYRILRDRFHCWSVLQRRVGQILLLLDHREKRELHGMAVRQIPLSRPFTLTAERLKWTLENR